MQCARQRSLCRAARPAAARRRSSTCFSIIQRMLHHPKVAHWQIRHLTSIRTLEHERTRPVILQPSQQILEKARCDRKARHVSIDGLLVKIVAPRPAALTPRSLIRLASHDDSGVGCQRRVSGKVANPSDALLWVGGSPRRSTENTGSSPCPAHFVAANRVSPPAVVAVEAPLELLHSPGSSSTISSCGRSRPHQSPPLGSVKVTFLSAITRAERAHILKWGSGSGRPADTATLGERSEIRVPPPLRCRRIRPTALEPVTVLTPHAWYARSTSLTLLRLVIERSDRRSRTNSDPCRTRRPRRRNSSPRRPRR